MKKEQISESIKSDSPIPKGRLITGGIIFLSGFISPVFIPMVLSSGLPEWGIAALSGLLAFGIPEIFMIIAVAILGKEGFAYLKNSLGKYLKPLAPPDEVSRGRYRVGLLMFSLPIIFGFLLPYLNHEFHLTGELPILIYIISDLLILASLFVLGGNFWDKLRGLFIHKAKIMIADTEKQNDK